MSLTDNRYAHQESNSHCLSPKKNNIESTGESTSNTNTTSHSDDILEKQVINEIMAIDDNWQQTSILLNRPTKFLGSFIVSLI